MPEWFGPASGQAPDLARTRKLLHDAQDAAEKNPLYKKLQGATMGQQNESDGSASLVLCQHVEHPMFHQNLAPQYHFSALRSQSSAKVAQYQLPESMPYQKGLAYRLSNWKSCMNPQLAVTATHPLADVTKQPPTSR